MRTLTCISTIALLAAGLSYGSGEVGTKLRAKGEALVNKTTVEPESMTKVNTFLSSRKLQSNPQLTARTPWIKEASMDMFLPGRWDTPNNRVSCSAHIVGGGGDWSGTVGYIKFKPPTVGTYVVITHFTGAKKTCHVQGPWGEASATTQLNGDDGEVIGMFTARSTSTVDISMWFTIPFGQGGTGATWFGTEFVKFDP